MPVVLVQAQGCASVPPGTRSARCALAAELPGPAWRALQVREGAVGPLVFEFAAVRVWAMRHRRTGPQAWLLIRRSLEDEPELKYYVSDADAEAPLSTLALVACARCQVKRFFEDCRSYLGMAQYETRSWVGWHHHMTLVGLAHLFVTLTQQRLKKTTVRQRATSTAEVFPGFATVRR